MMSRLVAERRGAVLLGALSMLLMMAASARPVQLSQWGEQASVVYVVRHAERADAAQPERDPHLSAAGGVRAAQLADLLSAEHITTVFSSDYHRTRETAQPLASRLGLSVQTYGPSDLAELAAELIELPGRHVVVGHSNTTPQLVQLLGGDPGEPIDDAVEFDRLYIVVRDDAGGVATLHLRYGAPSR
jgi:phosphohistidine phosphatase SixA